MPCLGDINYTQKVVDGLHVHSSRHVASDEVTGLIVQPAEGGSGFGVLYLLSRQPNQEDRHLSPILGLVWSEGPPSRRQWAGMKNVVLPKRTKNASRHKTRRNAPITVMPTTMVMVRRLMARLACILPISL